MKPHRFAQMVNEVRELAFQYGHMDQFRCRVADLLGKYIRVEHESKGVPEQSEIGTHAVVVPPLPKPTGRRADDAPVWGMPQDLEDVCRQAGNPVLAAYQAGIRKGHAIAENSLHAIPADRVLGDGEIATRWIPVSESLPEDGESVGFVINSTWDEWNHGRAVGGRFNRKHFDKGFGGFSFPGIEWAASHWCKLPPIPDTIRANQGGAAT